MQIVHVEAVEAAVLMMMFVRAFLIKDAAGIRALSLKPGRRDTTELTRRSGRKCRECRKYSECLLRITWAHLQ
jgi:hypothetical protein